MEKVKDQQLDFSALIWENVSQDAIDLIKSMLNRDFEKRISCKEALKNKWFQNASSKEVREDLMNETLKNLFNFNAKQKMQQATMSMMAQTMISKTEKDHLSHVF
jgi:calcium-dependent protein kinase